MPEPPITVGEYLANVHIRGVDDGVGMPNAVNSFQITPTDGMIELRAGNPGPAGPEGPAAWPVRWRGDVADMVALNAIRPTLGLAHKGYSYRVVGPPGDPLANAMMYWDGETFYPFLDAFGSAGPQGAPNSLTVGTVTTLAEGASATFSITGSSPNQVVNAGLPRGPQGEQGDPGGPGPIMAAPDVDNTVTLGQDFGLLWDAASSKFIPKPYPGIRGPWGLGESGFSTGSNVAASSSTIGQITIPPQSAAWRPRIEGGVSTQCHVQSVGESRVDVEVRIGSATGQIVAIGFGFPSANWWRSAFIPYFASAMTPDSAVGVVPANTTTTLFVVINRNLGTRNYSWTNSAANMMVYAQTVYAP